MTNIRFIGLSLLTTILFSAKAYAGCEKDTDCKGERICEASVCVNPTASPAPAPPPEAVTEGSEKDAETAPTEGQESESAPAETTDAPPAEDETPTQTKPEDWWKKSSREMEAAVLQEIFTTVPKPIKKTDVGKYVYPRSIPLVVADISDTVAKWGGKDQQGVHFLGISKVHTTTTLDDIAPETGGIAYCPLNCARITEINIRDKEISFMYDGPIKDWAGKAGDIHSGYIRKGGKAYKSICSLPMYYTSAPKRTSWLNPDEVKKAQEAVVEEIKRYCGK
jgi:hypothetical protein